MIEALLFAAGEPLTLADICAAAALRPEDARLALEELTSQYAGKNRGFHIRQVGGGYQFCTNPEYAPYIERLWGQREKSFLSQASLETLAIIAYKQPITRFELERIRGVKVDSVLNNLQEKKLIQEKGRGSGPGKPILYGTTREFLTAFGLRDLGDLPPLGEEGTGDSQE